MYRLKLCDCTKTTNAYKALSPTKEILPVNSVFPIFKMDELFDCVIGGQEISTFFKSVGLPLNSRLQ
jgi:hypothetical protein